MIIIMEVNVMILFYATNSSLKQKNYELYCEDESLKL